MFKRIDTKHVIEEDKTNMITNAIIEGSWFLDLSTYLDSNRMATQKKKQMLDAFFLSTSG